GMSPGGYASSRQRHDAIAHYLVDRPLVPVNGAHHQPEHEIKTLARILRVALSEQLHRALEVGEEDRDLCALALKGGLGRKDLLGEVLWRIGLGRCEPQFGCCVRRDGLPAL